jgi:PhnB protein
MAVKPIPDGYTTLSISLAVDDAARAIDFYQRAFGAKERFRMDAPGGKVGHAELEVGDSVVMVADPFPMATSKPPSQLGGTTCVVFMYVEDVDATVQRAVEAGATVTRPVEDMFWGDRTGEVADPFGHQWMIWTHVEDVPPAEMEERAKAAMAGMS